MKIDFGKCLIFSPHADDWFLGCTSIVKQFTGTLVLMSYWAGEQQDIMVEFQEAWKRCGGPGRWDVKVLNYTARKFDTVSAEIRDKVFQLATQIKPDTVFTAAGRHTDHVAATMQVDAATLHLKVSLWLYYTDKLDRNPTPNVFQPLEADEVKLKQDTWREVWRTQQWRVANSLRLDEPQLDGLERFYLVRGYVNGGTGLR